MDANQYDPEAAYTQARDKMPDLPEWLSLSHSMRMAFMEVYLSGAKHGISKMETVALDKTKHERPSDELPNCVWRDAETPFADNH